MSSFHIDVHRILTIAYSILHLRHCMTWNSGQVELNLGPMASNLRQKTWSLRHMAWNSGHVVLNVGPVALNVRRERWNLGHDPITSRSQRRFTL